VDVDLERLAERLISDSPAFHSVDGRQVSSALAPSALLHLARVLAPGQSTLETGCGASTVIFAAAGTDHTVVSPDPEEHRRIGQYCSEIGVDAGGVRFLEETSASALPAMEREEPLDLVLVDGAHAFPHPILDWHYLERRLRTGGTLVLDDIPIPSVKILFAHLRDAPDWQVERVLDDRTAVIRKTAAVQPGDDWASQAINRGYPDYSFLAPRRRFALAARVRWYRAVDKVVPVLRRLLPRR